MQSFFTLSLVILSAGNSPARETTDPAGYRSDTIVAVREALLPPLPKKNPGAPAAPGKNTSGYRLIALGGSLTAGFRNGGLYREGQQWSYPNLLARQMGVPFRQPLFSKNKGNGTGYILPAPARQQTGDRKVVNNLAISDIDGSLEPFTGAGPDNFAIPYFSKRMDRAGYLRHAAFPFFTRISAATDAHLTQWDWISSLDLQSDMFLFETGFDDLVHSIRNDGAGISQFAFENLDETDEMKTIRRLTENGAKGLLVNVPDVLSLPYFHQYGREILEKSQVQLKVRRSTSSEPVNFDPETDLLLPCETAEKIVNGRLSGTILLKDSEVISGDPYDNEVLVASPATFNRLKIARAARHYNLAVLDLYVLYRTILGGSYTTYDGIRIDPSWPSGNFFSADGIYPTALGQAVIANECILALNRHYGLSIPLIAIKELAGNSN